MNKPRPLLLATGAALLLAGCGVGIGLEITPDDDPPSVSASVTPTSAQRGQALRLSAVAGDDDFVYEVNFYRIDSDGRSTWLCSDRARDYDCNTQVPATALVGSQVNYFARAVDSVGQTTDSSVVTVTVLATPPTTPPTTPPLP